MRQGNKGQLFCCLECLTVIQPSAASWQLLTRHSRQTERRFDDLNDMLWSKINGRNAAYFRGAELKQDHIVFHFTRGEARPAPRGV